MLISLMQQMVYVVEMDRYYLDQNVLNKQLSHTFKIVYIMMSLLKTVKLVKKGIIYKMEFVV